MIKLHQQTRALLPLIFIIFIDSIGYMVSIPAFLRLFTEHANTIVADTSPTIANILFSLSIAISSFGYMLGAPLIGSWSDSWGRKRTLLLALSLGLIGFSLPIVGIYLGSLTWILVGRFMAGIASSSQSLAQTAIADISVGQQKAWYFALVAIAMTLSLLIGPTVGAYLSDPNFVSWFSDTTPFYATLLLIFVTLLLTAGFYQNTHHRNENENLLTLTNLRSTMKAALTTRTTGRFFMIFFLYELGWSFYYQDISLYLSQKYAYSVDSTSQFLAYTGICMGLGLTCGYKIITRYFSLSSLLSGSLIACSLSFLACTLTHNPSNHWLFVVPGAIGVGMIYPTIMTLISDSVTRNHQGCILGFAAATFSAPWGISALLVGPLTNISLSLPLALATLSTFGAMILSIKLEKTSESIASTSEII